MVVFSVKIICLLKIERLIFDRSVVNILKKGNNKSLRFLKYNLNIFGLLNCMRRKIFLSLNLCKWVYSNVSFCWKFELFWIWKYFFIVLVYFVGLNDSSFFIFCVLLINCFSWINCFFEVCLIGWFVGVIWKCLLVDFVLFFCCFLVFFMFVVKGKW